MTSIYEATAPWGGYLLRIRPKTSDAREWECTNAPISIFIRKNLENEDVDWRAELSAEGLNLWGKGDTLDEALEKLRELVLEHSPDSEYLRTDMCKVPMLTFFAYEHLPPHLREISKHFHDLAVRMVTDLPQNFELDHALHRLVEAKDCAVRAKILQQEEERLQSLSASPPQ